MNIIVQGQTFELTSDIIRTLDADLNLLDLCIHSTLFDYPNRTYKHSCQSYSTFHYKLVIDYLNKEKIFVHVLFHPNGYCQVELYKDDKHSLADDVIFSVSLCKAALLFWLDYVGCEHDWKPARNKFASGVDICIKCNSARVDEVS